MTRAYAPARAAASAFGASRAPVAGELRSPGRSPANQATQRVLAARVFTPG